MARSLWRVILLLYTCLFLPIIAASPSEGSLLPQYDQWVSQSPGKGFFRTVRDAIILSIWRPTERSSYSTSLPGRHVTGPLLPELRALYGNDVVLRFNVTTEEELQTMAEISETLYLDVWESTDRWIDVRLSKDVIPLLLDLLPPTLRTAHAPLMHDLAQAISDTYPSGSILNDQNAPRTPRQGFSPSLRSSQDNSGEEKELFFQEYQPISVIVPWMRLLVSMFPTHVQMVHVGLSYKGRDILGMKVGVHPTNSEQPSDARKTILIIGGSHAREWISVSTVTYVAYQMITGYGKNKDITKFVEEFDWIFVPTINPDGYTYTWDTDRLWRKNRQRTDLQFCQGVDLDRAWSFEWDGQSTRTNPCSESYAGIRPFDGVEAKQLADWATNLTKSNNANFVAFLDMHAYSQQVLYPYSYSCSSTPPSLENLEELAMGLAKSIRLTNNFFYGVSSACEGTTIAAKSKRSRSYTKKVSSGGSALDWFYHELGVKYAYQIKLRDTGSYGFILPKSNIVPTGREVFQAVSSLGKFLLSNKGVESVTGGDSRDEKLVVAQNSGEQRRSQRIYAHEDLQNHFSEDFVEDDGEEVQMQQEL